MNEWMTKMNKWVSGWVKWINKQRNEQGSKAPLPGGLSMLSFIMQCIMSLVLIYNAFHNVSTALHNFLIIYNLAN